MNKTDILNSIEYVYKNNLAKEVNILNLKIHNIYVSMYMIYKNIELNEYNIHYYKTLADNILKLILKIIDIFSIWIYNKYIK